MITELFQTLSNGYVAVKQIDHNIKWHFIILAGALATRAMTLQSTDVFARQSKFLKRITLISIYTLVFILVFAQFSPWIIAFWSTVFEYMVGL